MPFDTQVVEQVQNTALIVLSISWIFISYSMEDKVGDLLKILILIMWVASMTVVAVTALIRIWHW